MDRIDEELVVRTSGASEVVITRRQRPAWRQEIDKAIARARRVLEVDSLAPLRWAAVVPKEKKPQKDLFTYQYCWEAHTHKGVETWSGKEIRQAPGGTLACKKSDANCDTPFTRITSISICGLVFACESDSPEGLLQFRLTRELVHSTFQSASETYFGNRCPELLDMPMHFALGIEGIYERCMTGSKNEEGTPFPDESFFDYVEGTINESSCRNGLAANELLSKVVWGFNLKL